LERNETVRIGLGTWLLACVVFINAYISLVITGMSAPAPFESIGYFENLTVMNFNSKDLLWKDSYFTKASDPAGFHPGSQPSTVKYSKETTRDWNPSVDFRIFSSFYDESPIFGSRFQFKSITRPDTHSIVQSFGTRTEETYVWHLVNRQDSYVFELAFLSPNAVKREPPVTSRDGVIIFNIYNPMHLLPPRKYVRGLWNSSYDSAVEEEIVQCGRSAFVDSHSYVHAELKYLKAQYPWIQFTLSKEQILKDFSFLTFRQADEDTELVRGFKSFMTSGIYLKVKGYFQEARYKNRRAYTMNATKELRNGEDDDGPKAIAIHGTIQTTFWIYSSGVLICGVAFSVEIGIQNFLKWKFYICRIIRRLLTFLTGTFFCYEKLINLPQASFSTFKTNTFTN
jgi:hypothetical protein